MGSTPSSPGGGRDPLRALKGAWRALVAPSHPNLRILALVRRTVLVVLPLGAFVGFLTGAALAGLEALESAIGTLGLRAHLLVGLPMLGLGFTTLWLRASGLGEVSLGADLVHARQDPMDTFRFASSLGKVLACGLTIAFGGSAGTEGPGKWFGAALGAEYRRLLQRIAAWAPFLRRLLDRPSTLVQAGSAAALAAVFRAPLSGALLAAEYGGDLRATHLVPSLGAAATGYLAALPLIGFHTLLPVQRSYALEPRILGWALLLGLASALGGRLYHRIHAWLQRPLARIPLLARGFVAGSGLLLLTLPGAALWPGLALSQGSGMDLVRHLLGGAPPTPDAWAFFAIRLLATALTFAGGGVGGLWLPSIAMGAALGAGFESLIPVPTGGILVIVGASAFAGATHRVLLAPVVFLAETTGQAALVVPTLVATAVAFETSRARD